jgi:hypothetical protein
VTTATDGPRRGRRRRRGAAAALAAIVLAAAPMAGGALQDGGPAPNLDGRLYKAVFFSGAGVLSPADVASVPDPLKTRLTRFLTRRAAFKSAYKGNPESAEQARADAKRRAVERAIVSLVDGAGIEKTASEFVAGAPIAHEWEGLHDGPLAEAAYAENVLKKDPSSPLAPFLYVFIAARQRIAFETYENEKNEDGMKTAARKYRAFVERARAVEDPIYPALVADMERQPFLYIKATNHPRDYDPDS